MRYPEVSSSPNLPEIEKSILNFWAKYKTFQESLNQVGGKFVFYDGPPFANGLPHYGHLLTGFIKDCFARYQTMHGKRVERRFGWDCHGLPAEMEAEKILKISGKIDIEKFGIEAFNKYCRDSVLRYSKEWEEYVIRQARWVDFENDYKTMDLPFMESILWAFKRLYDKGLVYQSMRVLPYSWKCETPVSDFETRLDNAYRPKQSKTVTVAFKLVSSGPLLPSEQDVYAVVWTTTPWTLPSNLALAVGLDIEYVVLEKDRKLYLIAADLASHYENELGILEIARVKGEKLVGLSYTPIFPYFANHDKAFRILSADFVTTTDGTGIVHIAPGFGEDDYNLCRKHDIELVCPVDGGGKFTDQIPDFVGRQVFDTNDDIITKLKENRAWIKTEQYTHNYPHCWRTDTPLIYRAISSWYLNVNAIKEQIIANNQEINWIPQHIKNGLFGKWLENARDWSISRNRYWGCPLPIWQSSDPKYPHTEVYGSISEIENAFGITVTDLHRPFIDTLEKPNPSDPTGQSVLKRVPEILDCWFESGSMPFASVHYPFENKEWFEKHFPADFIVEYLAQTRGWFYTMLVLSTALFERPPFLNCIAHGVILGGDGQKLSKRLQNYVDPTIVFDSFGADALRWFMLSSPVMRGQEVLIDKTGDGIRKVVSGVIQPLWSAFRFFTMYANIDSIAPEFNDNEDMLENILDRYILTKMKSVSNLVQCAMDQYDSMSATRAIESFIDVMNNWYIRRSRERFWRNSKDQDKSDAYNTLYTVLHVLCRSIAPLLPLISEEIFRGINNPLIAENPGFSVHLQKAPIYAENTTNALLINAMDRVRDACHAALRLRNNAKIKIRQPLAKVTFIGVTPEISHHFISEELKQLVLDEVNVKNWEILPPSDIRQYANYKIQLNLAQIATRLKDKVQDIISANKKGEWTLVDELLMMAGNKLEEHEFSLKLEPKPEYLDDVNTLSSNDGLVKLDLQLDQDLEEEGFIRELVHNIQQMRKAANLQLMEKIAISISAEAQVASGISISDTIQRWVPHIKDETLACIMLYNGKLLYADESRVKEAAQYVADDMLVKSCPLQAWQVGISVYRTPPI